MATRLTPSITPPAQPRTDALVPNSDVLGTGVLRDIDRQDRDLAFAVMVLLFACYLLTFTAYIQSSDGLAMFATAENMVRRGSIDSNQLIWMGSQQGNIGPDGDLYSRKGLGMALLAYPLLWVARLWPGLGLVQFALLLNPLLTAWTGGLLFRAGRRLGWSRAAAVAVALTFGLATPAWPYTQDFFSDPVCTWGLFGAFYGLLGYSQTARKRYLVLGSIAWGIAYLARVINLLTLPLFLVGLVIAIFAAAPIERPDRAACPRPTSLRAALHSLFTQHWRPLVSFLIPVMLVGLVSLWWNWARYGSVWDSGYVETERFDGVWWFGIVGLIAGPARGLIWYSPALLLAVPGARWFWRKARPVLLFCLGLSLLYVLIYGKWYMWHGGYSWGPRFLVPTLPFLALLTGPAWEKFGVQSGAALWKRLTLWALVLVSVAVQWLGMLVPFGLVQDELARRVQPLFAPETFVRLKYSPLVLQWRFLSAENIHLAWWRADQQVDWFGLMVALAAVFLGIWLVWHRLYNASPTRERPASWFYPAITGLVVGLTLVLLGNTYVTLHDPELARAAKRIAQDETTREAIVFLNPAMTQDFSDVYDGRLPVYGFFPHGDLDSANAAWLARLRNDYARLWVVPDASQPDQSGWERMLRGEDFLLVDTRMVEPDGQRLALYTMSNHPQLQESGLGTIFGDPALTGSLVNIGNGWIRLDGYALTPEVIPGGELLLALRWESLRAVDKDYQVFVHLLNSADEKLAQRDGQPVQWLRPTSTWQPGEEIIDRYGLLLPNDLPAGSYTIAVGLYDPVSGQRLPISAGLRDYAIELGPILVSSGR